MMHTFEQVFYIWKQTAMSNLMRWCWASNRVVQTSIVYVAHLRAHFSSTKPFQSRCHSIFACGDINYTARRRQKEWPQFHRLFAVKQLRIWEIRNRHWQIPNREGKRAGGTVWHMYTRVNIGNAEKVWWIYRFSRKQLRCAVWWSSFFASGFEIWNVGMYE